MCSPAVRAPWRHPTILNMLGCAARGERRTRACPSWRADTMPGFSSVEFLPLSVRATLTSLRVCDPERALRMATARKRRLRLTIDGKLSVLAADHPARRVTKVGDHA